MLGVSWRGLIQTLLALGLLLSVALSQSACGTSAPANVPRIAGTYLGTVRNTTGGETSPFLLTLTQDGSHLTGSVLFSYPLAGSGPLTGSFDAANHLRFEITSDDGSYITLEFEGSVQENPVNLSGTYVINNGQTGTWKAPGDSGDSPGADTSWTRA